jgi:hypothetical protein
VLAAGLGTGAALIDQVFPGTGEVVPIAGEIVVRKYSRAEEFAVGRHGVELLERAGHGKGTTSVASASLAAADA